MLAAIRTDSAPPVGILLVTAANAISGSPLALRLPSALAGAAAVPIGAALGRRVGGPRAGLLAGAAVAVMPSLVLHSRDLRMYGLAATLAVLSALLTWRAAESPTRGRLLALTACVVVALHTHYFTGIAIAGQLLAVAIALRPGRAALVRVCAAAAAGLALTVPWLLYAQAQFQHAGTPFWVAPFDLAHLEDLWQEFVAGYNIDWSYPAARLVNYSRFVAAGVAGVGGLALLAWYRQAQPPARRRLAYLALTGAIPVLSLLVISVGRPLFDERYASILWATLVPAVGVGLSWVWGRRSTAG
jgi:4-amino-4-deoxy-L-arabinose transferase-like glycosyltransferase